MSPIELAAQIHRVHRLLEPDAGLGYRCQGCDWTTTATHYPPALEAHATHIATALSKAGLLPTRQEWAVRWRGETGAPSGDRAALLEAIDRADERLEAEEPRPDLVSRRVTEWAEAGR